MLREIGQAINRALARFDVVVTRPSKLAILQAQIKASNEKDDRLHSILATTTAEREGYKTAYEVVSSERLGYKRAYETVSSERIGYKTAYETVSSERIGYKTAYEVISTRLSALSGRVSAFVPHFFDIDMTKSQRSSNTHRSPWKGLSGRWYAMVASKGCSVGARRLRPKKRMQ